MKTADYTVFSSSHGTFTNINYILGHKPPLHKFKRTEIIQYLLLGYNIIKLAINYRKIAGKSPITWRLNSTPLNNTWVTE